MPTQSKKKAIVDEARRMVKRTLPELQEHAACLYLATASIAAAEKHGIRLVLQAGTCYWPRVTRKTDDGKESNVFGYAWDPKGTLSQMAVAMGGMPEMHVWSGDPLLQEIVDLSTGSFPVQCKKLIGAEWKAPVPPDFWWAPGKELPELCVYKPVEEATELAAELFKKSMEALKR